MIASPDFSSLRNCSINEFWHPVAVVLATQQERKKVLLDAADDVQAAIHDYVQISYNISFFYQASYNERPNVSKL